jgi:Putative MetA-pathway of phenol degradation
VYINLKRFAALILSIAGLIVNISDSKAEPLIKKTLNNQLDLSNNPLSSSSALSSLLDSGNTTPGLAQKPKTAIDRLNSISPRYAQSPEPSSPPPDKSQYNLFNPTPQKLWRDFSTDRPDKTETPFTVDGGRFTMEADLFVYTKNIDRPNDTITESYNYFVPNFKVGLTNNIDLQVIPSIYNVVTRRTGNQPAQRVSGFGDTTVRVKVNFWGNDGGNTAFGILPFVKIPTSQNGLGNGSVEGGVIFPFAVKLSDTWDVAVQTELDVNKIDSGYNVSSVNSVSFGHELSKQWSTYFELYTNTGTGKGFVATFDTGLKYLLAENVQLDAGVNIGLTEAADAIQPFLGVSVRF